MDLACEREVKDENKKLGADYVAIWHCYHLRWGKQLEEQVSGKRSIVF